MVNFLSCHTFYNRFGLVLGQCGVATALAITIFSAIMAALTACSVSALSTNGIFKGQGGAFQLLTRSLGPALGMFLDSHY